MGNQVSDLLLERYLLHEVTADELKRVELLIGLDSDLARRVELMKIENQHFAYKRLDLNKKANRLKVFSLSPYKSLSYALSICLLLIVGFKLSFFSNHEDYRYKGHGGQLRVYQNLNGQIQSLEKSSSVRAGASIQLSYQVTNESYGLIFSIDGRGKLTILYPENGQQLGQLISGSEVVLPSAMLLDDAPDAEVFFLLRFEKDIPLAQVIERLREVKETGKLRTGDFSIPSLIDVETFELKKLEK